MTVDPSLQRGFLRDPLCVDINNYLQNFQMLNLDSKQVKIDSTLTPQTASQRNLIWVKDTIFSPSAAPLLAQEIIRLINQGYCLGQPNINNPSGILVGLYKQI